MRTYALHHQRSAALQQYQACVRTLHEEFGAEPEQETQALYAAILREDVPGINTRSESVSGLITMNHDIQQPSPPLIPPQAGGLRGVTGVPEDSLHGHQSAESRVTLPPNNLPAQTTSFIGREAEVADVVKLLAQPDVRLLTLSGPGGSGKTRLGIQAAEKLLEQYADGVFFVSFAPISDPDLVVATIVTTLGLHVAGSTPPLEVLNTYLQSKQMLLVLDNFEQILAAAPVLNDLLTAAPAVKIMVTSRTVLRVSGEYEYLVPPLTLPDLSQDVSLESLTHSEAVQLFAARAAAMQSQFALTADNTPIVAQICTRLDGLPLAIELAAARINLFSPQALLNRLEHPLRLLSWGVRDLPARQQTLRATIEWSHHLLTPAEQTLFRRLAVFVGGWTLEAAEAVCAIDNDPSTGSGQVVDVLNGVQALVDHSLVAEREANGEPRLTMLETIREYALERLAESGEEDTIHRQHAQFFLAFAEEAERYWETYEQSSWLARLDVEQNNFRAALTWSIAHAIEVGLRLAGSLGSFWNLRGYSQEGRDWLANALTKSQILETGLERWQAKALRVACLLAWLQGDLAMACTLGEESVTLSRTIGDPFELAGALHFLGCATNASGDTLRARSVIEENIALCRQYGDQKHLCDTLTQYGYWLAREQEYENARVMAHEALRVSREIGSISSQFHAFHVLGHVAIYQKDYSAAQSFYEQALTLTQEVEDSYATAYILTELGTALDMQGHSERARTCYAEGFERLQKRGNEFEATWQLSGLGRVALHQHDWPAAHTHLVTSLTRFQQLDHHKGIAACLIGFAALAEAQGQTERAAYLLGARELLPKIPGSRFNENIAVQAEYDRLVAAVRNALGEEAFAAALAAGRALMLDQAIALALEGQEANLDEKS